MRERILMGIICLAIVTASVGCGSAGKAGAATGGKAEAQTEAGPEAQTGAGTGTGTESEDQAWYTKVLEDPSIKDQYPYYKLEDINLDGEDELFLSTTEDFFIGDENKACLMINDQGEAKILQEIGGAGGEYWICNQSDATLSYYSRLSGEGHLILYKIEDGALKEIGSADTYSPHHYPDKDSDEEIYLLDGKETSAKEAESFWEQYGNEAGALTYEAY